MSADQTNNGEALERRASEEATEMSMNDGKSFALLQRAASLFASSTLVPEAFQGNIANCCIALNMANRLRADPLMVMQNLYIVHGRPGWSSVFLIATFNQSGKFSAVRYEWQGEPGKPDWGCRAWAKEMSTGDRVEGEWITWKLANDEGWVDKKGSKWKTMPAQMFRYRAASWMIKSIAPEIAMGLPTAEELHDVGNMVETSPGVYEMPTEPEKKPVEVLKDRLKQQAKEQKRLEAESERLADEAHEAAKATQKPQDAPATSKAQDPAAAAAAQGDASDAPEAQSVDSGIEEQKSRMYDAYESAKERGITDRTIKDKLEMKFNTRAIGKIDEDDYQAAAEMLNGLH